jgi:hypothetical protein
MQKEAPASSRAPVPLSGGALLASRPARASREHHRCTPVVTGPVMSVPGAGVELLGTLRSKELDGFRLPGEGWRKAA